MAEHKEEGIEGYLRTYTGDRAKPETVQALDPLSSTAFDVLEGFRQRAAVQKEQEYLLHGNQERVQASFLNDFLVPGINKTPEAEIDAYYDTLNRVLEYTCRDEASARELYIFMDIARMLPENMEKAQKALDAVDKVTKQGKEMPDAVALVWGRINGMIQDGDSVYQKLKELYDTQEQDPKKYNLTAKRIKETAERVR